LEKKVETVQLRREQAEQERDELRRRLESLQEMRDALKMGAEPEAPRLIPSARQRDRAASGVLVAQVLRVRVETSRVVET